MGHAWWLRRAQATIITFLEVRSIRIFSFVISLLGQWARHGEGLHNTVHYLAFSGVLKQSYGQAPTEKSHTTHTRRKEQRARYPPPKIRQGSEVFQVSMFLAQVHTTAWLKTISAYSQHSLFSPTIHYRSYVDRQISIHTIDHLTCTHRACMSYHK
jgi:hypothetical protein